MQDISSEFLYKKDGKINVKLFTVLEKLESYLNEEYRQDLNNYNSIFKSNRLLNMYIV